MPLRDIVQTRTGRHVPIGCGFRIGDRVNIGSSGQWAFVLGETEDRDYPGTIDLLWVDCIGVIIIMQYTVEQIHRFMADAPSGDGLMPCDCSVCKEHRYA